MLELQAVCKRFSNNPILENVSLTVDDRRTTVLIGSSGCGKSTMLRLVLGLTQPDSGEILHHGESIAPSGYAEFRRRVGYVIQSGGLFPHLTARQNVSLVAEHLGWNRARIDTRLDDLQSLTHLPSDTLDRFPLQLSGGQRQRVALMRALMLDPDLLLLDEPLSALDPLIRYELQEELKEIFDTLGKTVVLVTHDLAEAAWFGDKIVLLAGGKIEQVGLLEDFVQNPASPYVAKFIRAQRAHHNPEGPSS